LIKSFESKDLLASFIQKIATEKIFESYDHGEGSRAILMVDFEVRVYRRYHIDFIFIKIRMGDVQNI
jgi:hypothetical protein